MLHPTHCVICDKGIRDTFDHLIECVGLRNIPIHDEFVVDYLVELSRRANTGNPGYPTKLELEPEICLEKYSDSSVEEISL